jgi:hypothetical protein
VPVVFGTITALFDKGASLRNRWTITIGPWIPWWRGSPCYCSPPLLDWPIGKEALHDEGSDGPSIKKALIQNGAPMWSTFMLKSRAGEEAQINADEPGAEARSFGLLQSI